MNRSVLINDQIDEFLSSIDKAESTKKLYRKTLNYFVTWLVKNNKSVSDPCAADVVLFKQHLSITGKAPATIDNYIAGIKSFFSWSVSCGYHEVNVARGITRVRDKHRLFLKSFLRIEQVFELLNSTGRTSVIEKRNRAIITLMCFTGLRCIEVRRLSIKDFRNADDKYFLQIQRKGHYEPGGMIPLPETITISINEYLQNRTYKGIDDTPLFMNHSHRSNNTRLSTVFISKMIKSHLRMIGLNSREYSAHSLRHTAATLARLAGSELYEIQYMLGHESSSQTEHYLRSLGQALGNEGTAILKINQFAIKYRERCKK